MKIYKFKNNYLFHFDLETNKLIESFGEKSYRNAYGKLEKFFEENNIIHDQYSGYRTKEPIFPFEAMRIAFNLAREHSDIILCSKKFSYSIIAKNYEISDFLRIIASLQKRFEKEKDPAILKEMNKTLSDQFKNIERDISDDL